MLDTVGSRRNCANKAKAPNAQLLAESTPAPRTTQVGQTCTKTGGGGSQVERRQSEESWHRNIQEQSRVHAGPDEGFQGSEVLHKQAR